MPALAGPPESDPGHDGRLRIGNSQFSVQRLKTQVSTFSLPISYTFSLPALHHQQLSNFEIVSRNLRPTDPFYSVEFNASRFCCISTIT